MPEVSKEEASERAQLVRLFEASTEIQYPTKDELNFRLAVMKRLGVAFRMPEVKALTITGPATADTPRPAKGGGR